MPERFIERRLDLGEDAEVVVRFFSPVRRDVDYQCNYEVEWPDRKRSFFSFGIDEVQALLLALKMVHAELVSSPAGRRGELRWLGTKDLGFPAL
jgi:hypothetical protein